LHTSPNTVRLMELSFLRLTDYVSRMGQRMYTEFCQNLSGNILEERRKNGDNINMDFWERDCGDRRWMEVIHDRDLNILVLLLN